MNACESPAARENFFLRLIAPAEPSPVRLAILWIILLLWLAVLVILYYRTVVPVRESRPPKPELILNA